VADILINAKRPVIYAGQGVHWADAYQELQDLAELLAIPVCTSLERHAVLQGRAEAGADQGCWGVCRDGAIPGTCLRRFAVESSSV
jgi:thiamine pyrophosphate-dependent acetolactate synthase large subunit-like protein